MADFEIFRDQLTATYPMDGHPLWMPNPPRPDRPVEIGDVGFLRKGKFHSLFNALLPADDPSQEHGVPEYHEQLVPSLVKHISKDSLSCRHYCSAGVSVETESEVRSFSPDDSGQTSFVCPGKRTGAVLYLPAGVRREDTLAKGDFGRWMLKHIDRWFAFAKGLGLGIEQMEELILVTGCDRTKSWMNIAFLGNQVDARVSFGVDVNDASINFQHSPKHVRGAMLNKGPTGKDLPENQCVFIRGFRVARTLKILPKHLKAAADPPQDSDGNDYEPERELISIPAATTQRDPLHLAQDYIAERASDCDMVLIHDDDLGTIEGIGNGTPPETFQPDVMMDLLRRSNVEIQKVLCHHPNTFADSVKVAMLPSTFRNWNIAPQSRLSPLAAQNIRHGHTSSEPSQSSPSILSDNSPASAIRNGIRKNKGYPIEDDVAVSMPGQGPSRGHEVAGLAAILRLRRVMSRALQRPALSSHMDGPGQGNRYPPQGITARPNQQVNYTVAPLEVLGPLPPGAGHGHQFFSPVPVLSLRRERTVYGAPSQLPHGPWPAFPLPPSIFTAGSQDESAQVQSASGGPGLTNRIQQNREHATAPGLPHGYPGSRHASGGSHLIGHIAGPFTAGHPLLPTPRPRIRFGTPSPFPRRRPPPGSRPVLQPNHVQPPSVPHSPRPAGNSMGLNQRNLERMIPTGAQHHMFTIPEPFTFLSLYQALKFEKEKKRKLAGHPLAAQLESCEGASSSRNYLGGNYSTGHAMGPFHTGQFTPTTQPTENTPLPQSSFDLRRNERHQTSRTPVALVRRRKRKALIIGINYTLSLDPDIRLRCCNEDAYSMANLLCDHLGFERDDVRIMTDEALEDRPTKANILAAMSALVHDAQPGDSFFFYFSGHGIQIKDMSGDGTGGLDECICAIDYRGNERLPNEYTAGVIVGDRMHELLVQPLPRECRLTAIFDCCYSGTILDLPCLYSSQGIIEEPTHPSRLRVMRQKLSYADAISIGVSKDHQLAREANGKGALRSAFVECMNTYNNNVTYRELIQSLRDYMRARRFLQRPLLSSSHEIDTDLPFIT